MSNLLLLPLALLLVSQTFKAPVEEEAYASVVSEFDLKRYVRELVAFGPRMGGTLSNDKSAAYLSAFFKRNGLDVTILEDPPALAHSEESWRVALEDGAVIESAYPFGFSPSTGGARTGRLLLVEELAKATPSEEWKGRVIYTPGDIGRAYAAIVKSGMVPAAILTSAPNDPKRYVDWSRLGSLAASATHPVPVFAVSYVDGRTLASAAQAGRTVSVSLAATIREGRGKTVIATLSGREPGPYYLVCAHGDSDSGGPGADDNASGVATVMEIARAYVQGIRSGKVARPRYSIRFAVWGAEYRSARTFIENEGEQLKQLRGVFNFDETGTGAERDAIYFESNDVPWNETILRTLESVAGDYAGRPGFWTEYTTNPSQGGTDSYAFLPKQFRGTGQTSLQIPSTTIYTAAWDKLAELDQTPGWESKGTPDPRKLKIDYSLYYHSSADTPENTTEREPQNMVRAVKVTGLALLRLNR
ncbi:MAG: M28 family peptidase [Acidobacteria bacterium]|nr:M28 family peptidase [Acidobacteriota bacterium]